MNPSVKPFSSNSTGAKAWFAALATATRLAGIALLMLVGTLLVSNPAMAGIETPRSLVVAPGNGSVALSWDYYSVASYVLTATASGQTTRTCSVASGGSGRTATCTVSPLTNGVTYALSLVATEFGTPSSPATVDATPGAPSAPTGVTAVGGDRSATVSWAASSANGTAVTGYTVKFGSGSTADTSATAGTCASASSTTTSCTITGLTNGTAYVFSVAALSAWGPSPVGISNPQAVVPATVSYTGTDQTYTVPAGMTSLNVVVTGGSGGADVSNCCHAGIVSATLTGLTPGQSLTVKVGGAGGVRTAGNGTGAAGGTYGGAAGGTASGSGTINGGFGGGGYSAIYSGSTALVVAGGGGGGGEWQLGGSGGGADGLGRAGNNSYDCGVSGGCGGGGGTASAGGTGGSAASAAPGSTRGTDGSALAGGAGGSTTGAMGGNGGGGGWFGGGGGGGGGGVNYWGGGGGAGSSYAHPTQASGMTYSEVSTLDSNYLRSGSVQIMFITAPTATGISPTSGTASGGTLVTVAGTDFVAGATVTVGGAVCTSPNVVSATSLTCTTGAGSAGAVNVVVSNSDSQSGTLTSGFTYVAVATYSVAYNGNTSTGGSVPTDGNTYANGASVSVLGNSGTLVKTGYTFNGWNTAADGSGTAQSAASTFTMGGAAVTLYAQWTLIPTYSVTYNANTSTGGSVPTDGATYANGATVTVLGNSGTLINTGYTFNGWNALANGSGTARAAASTFTMGGAAVTLYAQWTLIPVVPPSKPIPTLIPPPPMVGVGSNQLNPLNLSSGDGPAMTNCLRDLLRTVIGANAVYQGQSADGGARIGSTGLVVSFNALDASTSTSNGLGQGAGIYLQGTSQLNVVTSCGTFSTVPAMYNLTEWGAFLNGTGLSAQFNAQGVMTVVVGATTYVARPDYLVTQGEPGAARLVTGADGLMRFIDSAGNVQILYPAFIDPETLVNQVAQAVGGYAVIQPDGTALVTLWGGQKFVLTPDMTLGTVPPEQFAAGWWQDGPDHYRYRSYSYPNTSQGFTVTPR